jgi:DNA repair exonuclease SbcCD nuclease subunit
MNALLLADLHLTSVAREEYRWRLFPWLLEVIPQHGIKIVIILGDLTEAKDYHSSRLVNRLVDELCRLNKETRVRFIIVPGNHDGIDPGCPYFRFLGQFPFVVYMRTPFLGDGPEFWGRKVLFLPHTKEPKAWLDQGLLPDAEVIFMHQTVHGAKSETGHELEGEDYSSVLRLARRAKVWSGDVHVPQVIAGVEYVGAPYPVRFGDAFKPRAVLLTEDLKKATDLETPHFARRSLTVDAKLQWAGVEGLEEGDQVKVKVRLSRAEFGEWGRIKRQVEAKCNEVGVELCGLEVERLEESAPKIKPRGSAPAMASTPAQVLADWSAKQKLEKPLVDVGLKILASVVK